MAPKLYYMELSPPVRAVLMVAATLKVKLDLVEVHLLNKENMKPEYLECDAPGFPRKVKACRLQRAAYMMKSLQKLAGSMSINMNCDKNPEHTVPLYEDGDFILSDSHAIIAYLVTVHGKDDSLYPKDPKKRAIVDSRLHYDSSTLFSRLRTAGKPVVYLGETSIPQQKLDDIVEAYGFGEAFLGKSQWMGGDQVTIADYCCITSIISMDIIVPVDAEKFPKLTAWMKKCSSLPQYREKCLPGHKILRELLESKLSKH